MTFHHHADEGNSALDGGRHAFSDMTVSADGRMDVTIRVENHVALVGYCFNSSYFLRDRAGNVLRRLDAPQYCVDGSSVPWGRSNRQELITWQISQEHMSQIHDVVVVHGPGSRDTGELLQGVVQRGVAIYNMLPHE